MDINLALSCYSMGHRHHHSSQWQHRLRTSTWSHVAAQATHINMALKNISQRHEIELADPSYGL
jgi:GH24 family phage-related lysozyme (muramidase)